MHIIGTTLPPSVLGLQPQGHVPLGPRDHLLDQPPDSVLSAQHAQVGLDVRGRSGLLHAVDKPAGEVRTEVPLKEDRGPLLEQAEVVEAREVPSVDTLDERQGR